MLVSLLAITCSALWWARANATQDQFKRTIQMYKLQCPVVGKGGKPSMNTKVSKTKVVVLS
jgi:hypothetical protein